MMPKISRTTNPTDLKELDANCFSVRVQTLANGGRSFWLDRFDISKSSLEPGLQLDCVAHAGSTEEFFRLGTTGSPTSEAFPLLELATDRPLKFRFMIYKQGDSKLIAFVDNVRAVDEAGRIGDSLVDIEPADLNGAAWRLHIPELTPGGDRPVLQVEQKLFPTALAAARDPWIAVLVMPEVMRQIAQVIVMSSASLDDGELWLAPWAQFLAELGVSELVDEMDDLAKENWVEDVVSAFCARPALKNQMNCAVQELSGE